MTAILQAQGIIPILRPVREELNRNRKRPASVAGPSGFKRPRTDDDNNREKHSSAGKHIFKKSDTMVKMEGGQELEVLLVRGCLCVVRVCAAYIVLTR